MGRTVKTLVFFLKNYLLLRLNGGQTRPILKKKRAIVIII